MPFCRHAWWELFLPNWRDLRKGQKRFCKPFGFFTRYIFLNDFRFLHYFRFSRNAVVCSRDGVLTLLFRVANLRPSHLIEAHVRALVISRKITDEGEVIPFHQTELKVSIWH